MRIDSCTVNRSTIVDPSIVDHPKLVPIRRSMTHSPKTNPDAGARYAWRFHPERATLQERIARESKISPLLARLLVNRGIESPADAVKLLDPAQHGLSDPFLLEGMEIAVDRLLAALKAREPIVVYGDSDVDGVCGAAVLTRFLRQVGADVSAYIPNRLVEGYSLSDAGLAEIARRGARVVITVDNGTTAIEKIARLRELGVDVIVCDHHEPAAELPPAIAILNPKLPGSTYPFRHLCGSGVGFQLIAGLASRLPARGSMQDALHDLSKTSIAFVALATICDCVPLIGENRFLARAGIHALQSSDHPGLAALRSIAGIGREVQSDDLSFRLGPRINAAGRLGQAHRALALLLADDRAEAQAIARELDDKNAERQVLEANILESARKQAERRTDAGDRVLVLADESWHAGVVGIVAARIAGEFDRPTILVALGNNGRGRGSGRSVRRFDLHRALGACSSELIGFGGHAFAAGLEIEATRVEALRDAINSFADSHPGDVSAREILIDAELPLGILTPSFMHEINQLAPYGEGLASPLFSSPVVSVIAPKRIGRSQNHLSFTVAQGEVKRRAIAYGLGERASQIEGRRLALAFTPRLNLFRGQANIDLEVRDLRVE